MIRTFLAAAFDSTNSHDNWLVSLPNELISFVSLGIDQILFLADLLARFLFCVALLAFRKCLVYYCFA